jgi:hypothetical protein
MKNKVKNNTLPKFSSFLTSLYLQSAPFTSLRLTSPHFASLRLTSPPFSSLRLPSSPPCAPPFTSLHPLLLYLRFLTIVKCWERIIGRGFTVSNHLISSTLARTGSSPSQNPPDTTVFIFCILIITKKWEEGKK